MNIENSELKTFDSLINNPKRADVVLIVANDTKFFAHSNIKTLNSSYYDSALKPHWKQDKTEDDRIKLNHSDIDSSVFVHLYYKRT